jgi:iron complex outermembrane receptor protein
LPKFALIYKPSLKFTARLGGGLGYKLPSVFTEEVESLSFEGIMPIDDKTNKVEKSYGINTDLTYRILKTGNFSISLTEYLFYNQLDQPLVLTQEGGDNYRLINSEGYFQTKGVESLLKASSGDFHLYLGYTYVDAIQYHQGKKKSLPLTPKHSFHGDLMFVQDGKWRMGIDAEYESEQTLTTGRRVRSLFKAGFLAERTFKNLSFYINLENWTDTRQTRYENLVQQPFTNPRFTEVWAPLDGFIFNTGLKIKM